MNLQEIKSNVTEEGECLLWNGAMSGGTYPCVRYEGKVENVRTVLWLDGGKTIPKGMFVGVRCKNHRCVACLYLKKNRAYGRKPNLEISRRSMAIKMRKINGKLTEQDVIEIRASSESGSALAKQYNVCKSTINDAKIGRTWRDYSTPFAGLVR